MVYWPTFISLAASGLEMNLKPGILGNHCSLNQSAGEISASNVMVRRRSRNVSRGSGSTFVVTFVQPFSERMIKFRHVPYVGYKGMSLLWVLF